MRLLEKDEVIDIILSEVVSIDRIDSIQATPRLHLFDDYSSISAHETPSKLFSRVTS